jgi:hypothetical protein
MLPLSTGLGPVKSETWAAGRLLQVTEGERTSEERLRSAEVTLATIRDHCAPYREPATWSFADYARGYQRALADVLRILDSRWLPEGQPVIFDSDGI